MGGWIAIFRLGLVQMALGAVVVLTTSTLNRLMVVELALPAVLPGALVALHYGIQISRPTWGFFSDTRGGRTVWICAGMAALGLGAMGAALGVVLFETGFALALALSVGAYALIGLGVGAAGTSMLALLAAVAAPHQRAAAATVTWLMMIAGIALTAGGAGAFLDPYSPARLLAVVAVVTGGALLLTLLAVWRLERRAAAPRPEACEACEAREAREAREACEACEAREAREAREAGFRAALREVWAEPQARHFTVFVFLSMTAFFMQELILEPYAGLVFGFTPGQSTTLSGAQNGGVFLGMLIVGIAATGLRLGSPRGWTCAGCLGSAACLAVIAALGPAGLAPALLPATVALGVCNGMFAVAAIAAMMRLAGQGRGGRQGTRLGLWGAAQALAAGFGGLLGAAAVDLARLVWADAPAFGAVFLAEAALFFVTALMALRVIGAAAPRRPHLVPGE